MRAGSKRRLINSAVILSLAVGAVVVWWVTRPALDAETKARLEEIRAKALAMEAENRGLVCERPVLRGEPLDGPAGPVISSIMDLGGELGECNDLVRELREEGKSLDLADSTEDEASFDIYKPHKDLDDPVWDSESFVSIEEKCTVLVEAIQRAVRHVDACSPYLDGQKCLVYRHVDLIRLMDAIEIIVVRKIRRGETREAFELMLDVMRFGDDLGRGGADWFAWSLGGMGRIRIGRLMQQVLNSDLVRLDPAMLEQVDGEIALLVETAPLPFKGMRDAMVSSWLMEWWRGFGEGEEDIPFALACWKEHPPEERSYQESMRLKAEEACEDELLEQDLDLVADMLIWEWELIERLMEACPTGSPPRTCWESMERGAEEHADFTALEGRTFRTCGWSSEKGWHPTEYVGESRRGSFQLDLYSFWIKGHRRSQFLLQELRLLVAFRMMLERDGVCPSRDAFDEEPLVGLRDEATSGKTIYVHEEGPGLYYLQFDEEEWSEPQLMARCPSWARQLPIEPSKALSMLEGRNTEFIEEVLPPDLAQALIERPYSVSLETIPISDTEEYALVRVFNSEVKLVDMEIKEYVHLVLVLHRSREQWRHVGTFDFMDPMLFDDCTVHTSPLSPECCGRFLLVSCSGYGVTYESSSDTLYNLTDGGLEPVFCYTKKGLHDHAGLDIDVKILYGKADITVKGIEFEEDYPKRKRVKVDERYQWNGQAFVADSGAALDPCEWPWDVLAKPSPISIDLAEGMAVEESLVPSDGADDVPSSQMQEGTGGGDEEPKFTGKLSKWDIRDSLRADKEAIEKCFELVPEDAEKQEGIVTVRFVIGETGDVSSAKVKETTLGNVDVEQCIVGRVRKVKFPSPEGGSVLVEYPFMVRQGE
jgi:hypothetical protein